MLNNVDAEQESLLMRDEGDNNLERQSNAVVRLKERQESALRNTDAIRGQMRHARLRIRVMTVGVLIWKLTQRLNLWREGTILGATLFFGFTGFMLCDMLTGQRAGSVLCGLLVGAWTGFSLWYLYFKTTRQTLEQSIEELKTYLELCRGSAIDAMVNVVDLSRELDDAESKLGDAAQAAEEHDQRLARLYMQDWANMDHDDFVSFIVRVLKAQGVRHDPDFGGDSDVDLIVQKGGKRVAVRVVETHKTVSTGDISAALNGKATHVCHDCVIISASSSEPDVSENANCRIVDKDCFRDFVLGRVQLVS